MQLLFIRILKIFGVLWLLAGSGMLLFLTLRYFFSNDPVLLQNFWLTQGRVYQAVFYFHLIGASLAILVAPLQFFAKIRQSFPAVHRILGHVYIITILFWAAPTGFYLACLAPVSWWGRIPLIIASLLWWVCTWKLEKSDPREKILEHRSWALRSYALALTGVTFRLLRWEMAGFGWGLDESYIVGNWASLVLNLAVAEILIFRIKFKLTKIRLKN